MSPPSLRKRKNPLQNISAQPPAKKSKETHTSDGQFQIIQASMVLSVPPVFAANPRAGVEEMLDSMIMRYIPSLRGVVMSHAKLMFVDKKADIQRDCPFLVCTIAFDVTVWCPYVGVNLWGKVNLCSPDHISLLVHRTFNVSIPRHHIPTDLWEFEYGPAENDPEFGQTAQWEQKDNIEDENTHRIIHSTGGRWVHKLTGDVLGGNDGSLEFTVIGLTVANEMISLLGSLQPNPFSPRHVIQTLHPSADTHEEESESTESEIDASELATHNDSNDDASDIDTFQSLGKRKDSYDQNKKSKNKF